MKIISLKTLVDVSVNIVDRLKMEMNTVGCQISVLDVESSRTMMMISAVLESGEAVSWMRTAEKDGNKFQRLIGLSRFT
mgnify:CR=1 FL=1